MDLIRAMDKEERMKRLSLHQILFNLMLLAIITFYILSIKYVPVILMVCFIILLINCVQWTIHLVFATKEKRTIKDLFDKYVELKEHEISQNKKN